jgi:pimeloyl-ACP methyl ester carboxylesterase
MAQSYAGLLPGSTALAFVLAKGHERCMLNTIVHGDPTDRTPLLIAHGLFGSARNWGVVARRLATDRQVVAADMRNHGASPWFDSQTYADMAGDLAEVIAGYGGQMDVLGHSMGGKAAMVLAATHPTQVRRLIVADIAPVAYGHTQADKIAAMLQVDPKTVDNRAEARAQLGDHDDGLADFFLQSLDLKEKRWRLNLDVLAREMTAIIGFPDLAGQFDGPTLFLTGALSDYVRPEHRAGITALFPGAKFARIPGAGHWLHADKPREFVAAVDAFLQMKIP